MPADPSDFDPQKLWQSQAKEHDPMTIAEIHTKARAFQSRVRRRNAFEYVGCGIAGVGFLPALLNHQSWMMQIGAGAIIVALAYIAWQLHRRASARTVTEGGEALVDAYRRELVRQRDAVRSVLAWYIAPAIPGMTLLFLGRWFQAHAPHRSVEADHRIILLMGGIAALVFLVIWLLNQRGAEKLQRRIEEL